MMIGFHYCRPPSSEKKRTIYAILAYCRDEDKTTDDATAVSVHQSQEYS